MTYYNPTLYPADYPVVEDGQGLEIFDTLDLIQLQARDTSVRSLLAQRIANQGVSMIQGERARTNSFVMPLFEVGATRELPQRPGGTAAFLGGGRGHGASSGGWETDGIIGLTFSNETVYTIGSRLSDAAIYMGTVWSPRNGYYCGGWSPLGGNIDTVEGLDFRKLLNTRIGGKLSRKKLGMAGGIQNRNEGFLLGGQDPLGGYVADGERFDYSQGATPSITDLGSKLSSARFSAHNGTSNQFTGYVFGGHNAGPWDNWDQSLDTIEKFAMNIQSSSILSARMGARHLVHAAFGTSLRGYVAGGTGVIPITSWFGDAVSRLTYDGETYSTLGSRLTEPKVCIDGIGSSTNGYAVGGDAAATGWVGSRTIERLDYANETVSRIGARLFRSIADQGATADYAGGF